MPGSAIHNGNRTRITIVGETVLPVMKSDRTSDNVGNGVAGRAEFIAITIAFFIYCTVGKYPVAIGDAILN